MAAGQSHGEDEEVGDQSKQAVRPLLSDQSEEGVDQRGITLEHGFRRCWLNPLSSVDGVYLEVIGEINTGKLRSLTKVALQVNIYVPIDGWLMVGL